MDPETDETRAGPGHLADGGHTAEDEPSRESAEIQRALGVETTYGYHVESRGRRAVDALAGIAISSAGDPPSTQTFPCLSGYTYNGCLGDSCPLEECWTGGATVSFARKKREETRVSVALYLPGAPCHTCVHLVEDEVTVPAPRAMGQPGATRSAVRRAHDAAAAQGRAPADILLQRVNCGQQLWAHAISLASFLSRRIPMLDPVEPERCPGYARRPDPHPAVVAHLRQRRERARLRRGSV